KEFPIVKTGIEQAEKAERAQTRCGSRGPGQTVCPRLQGVSRADGTGGAGGVDDNDACSEGVLNFTRKNADHLISRSARCPWDDNLNRAARLPRIGAFGGPIARICRGLTSEEAGEQECRKDGSQE